MKTLKVVLSVIGRTVTGAMIFLVIAGGFLALVMDGSDLTSFDRCWMKVSLWLCLPLGYPVYTLVYNSLGPDPRIQAGVDVMKAIGNCQRAFREDGVRRRYDRRLL